MYRDITEFDSKDDKAREVKRVIDFLVAAYPNSFVRAQSPPVHARAQAGTLARCTLALHYSYVESAA
jgi:hypothetical protein